MACKPRDNRISLESIQSTVDSIKNSEKKEKSDFIFGYCTVNRGIIPESKDSIIVSFPYFNNTNVNLTISDLKTSCSCTIAYGKRRLIAPRQSGTVKVKIDLRDIRGDFMEIVEVSFKGLDRRVLLYIYGEKYW